MRTVVWVALALLLGACGLNHSNSAVEDHPDIDIGAGATVVYPGETTPALPRRSGASGGAGAAGTERSDAARREPTMLGGMSGSLSKTQRNRQTPFGPITTIFGYPFWIFGKSIHRQAEEAVQSRQSEPEAEAPEPSRTTVSGPDRLERERVMRENREMQQQLERESARPAPRAPETTIAEELAALERSLRRPEARPTRPPAPRATDAVDRNGDGNPDLWVFDEARGRRELLDENHDGRADRELRYDAQGQLTRSAEDGDGDGRMESVTVYANGEPARRRSDSDGDGQVDSWSFFAQGELVRREVDRDGDGFRDLVFYYSAGSLLREEADRNGDGRPDVVTRYRNGEKSEVDEDLDFDGTTDVKSYFQAGKLIRKEVRSEDLLEQTSKGS
ncbi:MAG: hypothetical protein ACE5IL_00705 [Myxococcota bacterium]